jgi:hypothetical protein
MLSLVVSRIAGMTNVLFPPSRLLGQGAATKIQTPNAISRKRLATFRILKDYIRLEKFRIRNHDFCTFCVLQTI